MNTILILFVAGVILLGAEVILPGAVAGIAGGLLLVAGCVFAFVEYGPDGGWIAVGSAIVLVTLGLVIEFWLLPRTSWGKRFFLNKAIDATSHSTQGTLAELQGKVATVVTPLVPSGYVALDGRQYEAFCQDGSAEIGSQVRIVGVDTFRIIVTHT